MRRAGSVSLFAAISLALHIIWVLLAPQGERQIQPAANWVEVSFETEPTASLQAASAPDEPSPLEQQPEPSIVQPPEPRIKKEQIAKTAPRPPIKAIELAPQPEAAEPSAPAAPEPPQVAAAEPGPVQPVAPRPLSIMPRAAALTLDAFAQPSGLRCGNRQSECADSQEHAAQAALTRDLNAAAHSVRHLKAREHAKLKRRSDGSYAYDGHVFQAVVRPDGNVEFRDNAVQGELRVSPVPFVFTADLNDVVERHVLGRELYSAEKQWLLEDTRELRDQLAGEFRRREQQGANRELERTLQSVLGDSTLTLAKKHEEIFLLWEGCGEDGQAQAHRHAVDRFVKRYMPKGSAFGFLAEELEHFNASRGRLQKFEPYAGS
jgi:hypothetical protein